MTRFIYTATGIVTIILVFMRVIDLVVGPETGSQAKTDRRVIAIYIFMVWRATFPFIVAGVTKNPSLFT